MRWIKGVLPTALTLVALLLTVGATPAISNGRSWIELVSSSEVFGFLALPQVRTYITAAVFFALGYIARGYITRWKARSSAQTSKPNPYDLYSSMDILGDRIKAYFQTKHFGSSESGVKLAIDCHSFNITLRKAGYLVPDITKLDADSRLGVLGFYYEHVGPYLRDGHVAEAKDVAAGLSKSSAIAAATNGAD